MKALFLRDAQSGLPSAGAPMTDVQFLEREIAAWLESKERAAQIAGEEYYNGNQAITCRERRVVDASGEMHRVNRLPNNRIVDNQYAKMVDQKTNYLLGRPFSFDTGNDAAYDAALGDVFSRKTRRLLRNVAEAAYTGGKAWVYPYYGQDGALAFTAFPAHEILPFWADREHTELDAAVRLYAVTRYNDLGKADTVNKAEVYHAGGIDRFEWKKGKLIPDPDNPPGSHAVVSAGGKDAPYNWERLPLVCFKANRRETPLLLRVKCLQDALNLMLSNFANNMEEDVRNTVLVLKNYDGEDLGDFRHNLTVYGAVKVRDINGAPGGVETLTIEVNAENYKAILELLKKAIVENARGFDAKDDRLSGTPNQLNIRSMYSDIDLDANELEAEFQAAFEELLWFVNQYLANSGKGAFDVADVKVIFDRDILVNESETIDNGVKSAGILSRETIVKQHPWVSDPAEEIKRIQKEEQPDTDRAAFNASRAKQDE
ncbi:MAG: phage portal protein [Oscillospiraceae bacterium]|nr:phage portal protein [Oscillospiraceae bacterium]